MRAAHSGPLRSAMGRESRGEHRRRVSSAIDAAWPRPTAVYLPTMLESPLGVIHRPARTSIIAQ